MKKSLLKTLSVRLPLLFVASMLVIMGVMVPLVYQRFHSRMIEQYTRMAEGVTQLMVNAVDGDRVNDYIEQGFDADGYDLIYRRFYDLASSSDSIEYVYAYQIREDGCHVVFDADTPELPGSAPGEVIEFDDAFLEHLPALLAGEEIEPIISDEKYGWLLSVYEPVFDSNGRCQCYIGVDLNMNQIRTLGYQFLARVISLLVGFFLLILAVTIWLAEYNVILPINAMAMSTEHLAYNSGTAREEAVESIRELDIQTGDEIENLYHSVT